MNNKNYAIAIILSVIIAILAIIFDIYLVVDVIKSIIDDTKTTLQLTFEILVILIGVPLCYQLIILVIFWISKQFK